MNKELQKADCYYDVHNYQRALVKYLSISHYDFDALHLFRIGCCYKYIEYNEKVIKYWQKAVDLKYASAEYNLANCYFEGSGVYQDYDMAIRLYTSAARNNNANAMNSLGECYLYGNGVMKNYKTAVKWFNKTVDNVNIYAKGNLNHCYLYGYGVKQDMAKTVKLYTSSKSNFKKKDKKDLIDKNRIYEFKTNGSNKSLFFVLIDSNNNENVKKTFIKC